GTMIPAWSQPAEPAAQWIPAKRTTLAIRYPDNESSAVDMMGTGVNSNVTGRAEAKRADGRTRIKLRINDLQHPQNFGSFYTTYVVWAVTPEGQTDNLGELPMPRGDKREIEVTTPYQTFGLIVTAEPYGLVKYPGPVIVAENVLRKDTKGNFTASNIEYRGDPGIFYVLSAADRTALPPDYTTPLVVLGARRAVEIARRAGAERFASAELKEAETKLATLERIWPPNRRKEEKFAAEAREVVRLAEAARTKAVEEAEAARLTAERRAADRAINQAQTEAERARLEKERAMTEAERARSEAAQAQRQAEDYRAQLARNETELAQARQRASEAQTEAERAKAREEVARLEAERTRVENEQIKRERDEAMQRLQVSLSEILETRREARGLIVNLSDVLFDFNKATLKPGAKEKLSKLAGVLLAYPGNVRMEIEGHTDSVGSHEYNQKLSEARAGSVRDYLVQAGVPAEKITAVRGLGETKPVATNDTEAGRQMNRRVEIIIADAETQAAASRR
ncbi:MAG TPA: OmpA family protein, partial [Blastocatellia bacterium]|nr:OmpA family protein [Blastocatellia bacterium]